MRLAPAVMVFALLLTGCGGGENADDSADAAATKTATAPAVAPKSDASARADDARTKGKPALADLSGFSCETDAAGDWQAGGVIHNGGKSKAAYQVVIYLGPADGKERKAKTKAIGAISAGQSLKFAYKRLPDADVDDPCFVQVLRTNSTG